MQLARLMYEGNKNIAESVDNAETHLCHGA